MVGGNSYSRLPGNVDVFIPGNTGMKKSRNPGWPGMNSLLITGKYMIICFFVHCRQQIVCCIAYSTFFPTVAVNLPWNCAVELAANMQKFY